MKKKFQVFVSSTYKDLIEERQTAVNAILNAGHIPAGMELFKAGKSQLETIYKWIDESDVYMLILGGRYGSIEETSGLSYTELEYEYACKKNKEIFSVVLQDNFLSAKAVSNGNEVIYEQDNRKKYDTFKENVQKKIVKFADNMDQISIAVHSQLNDIVNNPEYESVGWVRMDYKRWHSEIIILITTIITALVVSILWYAGTQLSDILEQKSNQTDTPTDKMSSVYEEMNREDNNLRLESITHSVKDTMDGKVHLISAEYIEEPLDEVNN